MGRPIETITLHPMIDEPCLKAVITPKSDAISGILNKTFFSLVGGTGFEPVTSTV